MRASILILVFAWLITAQLTVGQSKKPLSPENNLADQRLIKDETTRMTWFLMQDTVKRELGTVATSLNKKGNRIYLVTTVRLKQSQAPWTDSTVVSTRGLRPIYHSSYNQQRDMVLKFTHDRQVTGYYFNKKTGEKALISEEVRESCFDSNFYPHYLRWLPLKENYSQVLSIFDYNPGKKIGAMTATIANTETTPLTVSGKTIDAWKVTVTDDISDNVAITCYYIAKDSRKLLKQEMTVGARKMWMVLED